MGLLWNFRHMLFIFWLPIFKWISALQARCSISSFSFHYLQRTVRVWKYYRQLIPM